MKKVLPFIYLFIGIFILINTFSIFFQKREVYRLLFSFTTENQYVFLLFRVLFASWFIVDGVKRLKRNTVEK
ncbi:hypothetical protein [Tenacibaculum sediminilitoris]|uniref:hypothetical protein n=1 Tax=Tenacibaculum sediminilitoris TaxID=1820334 RepID=UPI0038B5E8B7